MEHIHAGKVRELHRLDDGRLVMLATDRISAFDHVLSTPIPDKGRILTAMSVWWFGQLADIVPSHLISYDDLAIPAEWRGRAIVCAELEMIPVEAIARGYLAGSGVLDYRATGEVCGNALPSGLNDGDKLPEPIFTPATKAAIGEHDENVSYEAVAATVGDGTAARLKQLTLAIYTRAADMAAQRGIILADTKFEFGRVPGTDDIILGDEVLTPDSSRFWPADRWRPGGAQPSYDKQYVRDWLLSPASGWDRAGDEPPPPLPDDVIEQTRARYIQAYERLTGLNFADWTGATSGPGSG
jgi:phosphoribosylaminoimidazole-succinocarboxamide synthase